MRIALFSETYLPQRNGVAILLDRLARHLAAQGHAVLIAAPEAEGAAHPPDGVELVRIPGVPLPRYPDLSVVFPYSGQALRAVRDFRPAVIHALSEYTMGLMALHVGKRLGVPVVGSYHTNVSQYLGYYGFGWLSELNWRYVGWFYRHMRLAFCPSEATRVLLADRGIRDARIWGRGVDLEHFHPARRSSAVRAAHGPPGAIHLLYVGRLTPEKDLPVLYDAYRMVRARRPDPPVHLVLTGDGSYSGAARASAPVGVTFTGFLAGERLAEAYASADVFVFPSRTETLGNVVLEACASGIPVVCAAQGGVLENVRDGENGLMFSPGDPAALARSILALVDDADLRARLGKNARAWAEHCDWDAAFEPLIQGYAEAARR